MMSAIRYHIENLQTVIDKHWAIRLIAIPILFLATLLTLYSLATGHTGRETATIVVGYLFVCSIVVVVSLVLEYIVKIAFSRT